MLKFLKICSGPFSLFCAYWFIFSIVPQLNPKMQSAIDYGGLGTFLGFFGSATIFVCLSISWIELKTLFTGTKVV